MSLISTSINDHTSNYSNFIPYAFNQLNFKNNYELSKVTLIFFNFNFIVRFLEIKEKCKFFFSFLFFFFFFCRYTEHNNFTKVKNVNSTFNITKVITNYKHIFLIFQ